MILLYCVIAVFMRVPVVIGKSDCELWSDVENYLKQNIAMSFCEHDQLCIGLNCSGIILGENFHGGIQIEHCKSPASIKLFADAPQLSIHHWQHSFVHGETFKISDDVGGEITLQKESNNFIVGLKLKLFSNKQQILPLDVNKYLEKDILKNAIIPVPLCDNENHMNGNATPEVKLASSVKSAFQQDVPAKLETRKAGNCTINAVTCSENEICHQLKKSYLDGVCLCRPMYSRNQEGVCIYSPESDVDDDASSMNENTNAHTSADKPGASSMNENSNAHKSTDKPGHAFLLPLLVSVGVVLLLISLIYTAKRFKILDRLHRRFRVRVYEHVLLEQDEDNDDPLTDPVA